MWCCYFTLLSLTYSLMDFKWSHLEMLVWFLLCWTSWNMLLFYITAPKCTANIMQNESVIGCQVASPSRKQSSGITAIITLDAGAFNILCDHFKPYPGLCLYSNNPLLPIVMCIPPKRTVYASISSWQSPDVTTFPWHILWRLSFAEAAARIMILVAHAGMLKYFHRAETCVVTAGQVLLG